MCDPLFIDYLQDYRNREYMNISYFDNCYHDSVPARPF